MLTWKNIFEIMIVECRDDLLKSWSSGWVCIVRRGDIQGMGVRKI
jgi:hypothetical protein